LFLELASVLSYIELVAVADHLVLDPRVLEPGSPRPLATLADLRADSHTAKSRGARTARDAARAAREGVESPMETALRLLLIEAGTPEPLCGYELSGIGWFDLAWPEYRTIAEYDGDQHRTSTRQYERDIRRFDQATDRGWRVVRVRQRGILVDAGTTAHRVRAALIHGGWLPNGRESA
jgi:hypothetical protein